MHSPKVSIITASFNVVHTIGKTISSVISQTYENYEYIIIDGGSTDGTLEVIKEYADRISCWLSEPDQGMYDAWNKGLCLATGEWIAFLGADDYCAYDEALEDLVKLARNDTNFISSKSRIVDRRGVTQKIHGAKWNKNKFLLYFNVAHPLALHHKSLFELRGLFDVKYKISSDYEFLLRCSDLIREEYLNLVTVNMADCGMSCSRSFVVFNNSARETFAIQFGYNKFFAVINYLYSIFNFFLNKIPGIKAVKKNIKSLIS